MGGGVEDVAGETFLLKVAVKKRKKTICFLQAMTEWVSLSTILGIKTALWVI